MIKKSCTKILGIKLCLYQEPWVSASFPQNLEEIKELILAAFVATSSDKLLRVWDELDFGIDVCDVMGAYGGDL